jgi:hypothetical protein
MVKVKFSLSPYSPSGPPESSITPEQLVADPLVMLICCAKSRLWERRKAKRRRCRSAFMVK